MKNHDVSHNGLKLQGYDFEDIVPHGNFNAVFSRAGIGKTSFVVQIALNAMLKQKNVLHIGLGDPVDKISLWYKEIFCLLAEQNQINYPELFFESLLKKRFIMTFNVDTFSFPRLEERLKDLSEQNIFSPSMLVIDGLDFDNTVQESLSDLKAFAEKNSLHVWFTVRTHRHEDPEHSLFPVQLSNIEHLFDLVIQLRPDGKKIYMLTLKGGSVGGSDHKVMIDPSSMLIQVAT